MYDDIYGNKCIKCPDFTSASDSKDRYTLYIKYRCELYDIIENSNITTKFNIKKFKKSIDSICKKDNTCYGKFIGPIKSIKSQDTLFFISFANQAKIELKDYSFSESINENLNGHIFGLFEEEHSTNKIIEESTTDSKIIQNLKVFKNLGSRIKKIMISPPSNRNLTNIDTGVLINYELGDKCPSDPSN